ncbi:MAG TPA: TolC family protein, partial [Bacillota bacterium]
MTRKMFMQTILVALLIPSLAWGAEKSAEAQWQTLTLEKCLELAYANNQELKSATQDVVIAKANVKKAQGAFLPTLDYELGATKLSDPTTVLLPYIGDLEKGFSVIPFEGPDEGYGGSLSATYPLYTGGKLRNALKIAKTQLDLALEKERNVRQKLTYNVKST